MQIELENFEKFNAYELVENVGQRALSSGWVITEKASTETVIKARLVVHGN